jgi:class 3 adenylate cyclase/DNA-binding SARP family transcriptional activator/WD40 repeat protein/energy-coupling factor transporter ATP-binding protein EcfA2
VPGKRVAVADAPEQVVFRVLGPFEVLVGGRAAALGGARQRLVLAGLVANANAVVSNDRLVDMVWGEEPPDTALTTVQKYVHRLRGVLGERILTRAPGYVLRIDDGESDVSRFERLLADATRLTTAGELGEAMAAFDAALGLWRGPAWAEFADFDFARAEVARLEGLRANAIEDRTEVALAAGHHAELIGELEATVGRYPLRERPRAQLMLALYRSGRHADALRAYDAFRHYLGEEVGLEPSGSLAGLNDAIVWQKPELDWAPPPGARGRAALPSGTVTFLFSDIEGSTRLFRQLGHSYVDLLERHRRLVRAAVATAGGVEVNSEGDGLFFAFSGAAAALTASVEAQQALVAEPWPAGAEVRVRMGLHTGEATPHNGDYVAIAVHQAARVLNAAHGGQVLLSQATAAAIGSAVPGECSVVALGTFPLKDFDHGVELFEARHPALLGSFPPPRVDAGGQRVPPLPPPLSADSEPLVGRTSELEWLDVLWQRAAGGDGEAVLVYGPPGIGKSRLVAEFARHVHASGATVTLSVPARVSEPVLAALDDFDGSTLPAPPAGVLVLAAARQPVAGAASTRELRGLSPDEVGLLLAHKIDMVNLDLTGAVHTETHGNPGQVHDVARRLRDREAEDRVRRALDRVGSVTEEARQLRAEIAGGVLRRERLAALTDEPVAVGVCPYKGLARYEAADAAFFYGRERLVAALVARIAVDRFVGIIGASGSGKSSLVRAGLLPALSAGALPGSGAWPACTFAPGEHPLRSFAEALAPLAGIPGPELARRLDRRPDELGSVLEAAVRGREGARVVVVVDQFEEAATLCRDQEEREQFAAALVDAVTDPSVPAVVVPIVRADYYRAMTVHPELARLFEQSQLLVGAMSDADLRRAITEPARRAGLALEDGLVDAVCTDAGPEPGALPLVSTAMAETWVRRDGAVLGLAGYRDVGGVHGALARLADDVYAGLDDGARALARTLFLRLAEPGEGTDDIRRRMPREEFSSGGVAGDDVLDAFVGRRLLVADRGSVEVAHEALLREWPRLRTWLEEDRYGRRLHRHLTEAAAAWAAEGRDPGALYRGTRLGAAQDWAVAHPDALNPAEREFLDASAFAQQQELLSARRTNRRLRRLLAVVGAALVLAVLAGSLAAVQTGRANRERQLAQGSSREALLHNLVSQSAELRATKRDLAALLALAAYQIAPRTDTLSALVGVFTAAPGYERTIPIHTGQGYESALLPDGRTIAVTDERQGLHLIDLASGRQVAAMGPLRRSNSFGRLALSPDGRYAAVVSSISGEPNLLTMWDLTTHHRRFGDVTLGVGPNDVAFSPDGALVAVSGGDNGDVEVHSAVDGAVVRVVPGPPRPPHAQFSGYTAAVAFLADGSLAVASQQGPLRILDPRNGSERRRLEGPREGGGVELVVSADGRTLFSLGFNAVVAWDLTLARPTWVHQTPSYFCSSIAPAQSVGALLCGRTDGHVSALDLATGVPVPLSFDYQQGSVSHLTVAPDGNLLVATGGPVLEVWHLDGSGGVSHLIHPDTGLTPQEYETGGQLMLSHPNTAGPPTQPQLVDPATGAVTDPLAGIVAATAAPGSDRLAGLFSDGTGGRYDLVKHERIPGIATHLPFIPTGVTRSGTTLIIYSDHQIQGIDPEGRLLPPTLTRPAGSNGLAATDDGLLFSFEPAGLVVLDASGRHITASPLADVNGVATIGRQVVVSTIDGQLKILDTHTLQPSGPQLPAVVGLTYNLQLTQDGTRLMVVGTDGTVRIADMATRTFIGDPIDLGRTIDTINPTSLTGTAINYNGNQVALATPHGVVIWDLDPARLISAACRFAGRNLTEAEWQAHIGTLARRTTLCPTEA